MKVFNLHNSPLWLMPLCLPDNVKFINAGAAAAAAAATYVTLP